MLNVLNSTDGGRGVAPSNAWYAQLADLSVIVGVADCSVTAVMTWGHVIDDRAHSRS